jgi:hypothetical protein
MNRLRDEQTKLLHRLEWIDRDKSIARIPIDSAMDKLVARSAGTAGAASSRSIPKWRWEEPQP